MKIDELQEGMTLNNNELMDTFLCSSQGGMRRSKRTNSLVLISDQTKLYNDRWQGDILHYTGMEQTGDQDFSYIQNRTLYESDANGVQIHLFEVFHPQEYTYYGRVKLAAAPYTETQSDVDGQKRQVCMFPLKKA